MAAHAALSGEPEYVADAYNEPRFDLSSTHAFDAHTGYHSVSFLSLPLRNTADEVIGVLQLINAHDPETGQVTAFSADEVIDSRALISSAGLSVYIREQQLRQEIDKLKIEVNQARQTRQVEEITESDDFQRLQAKAAKMRQNRSQE